MKKNCANTQKCIRIFVNICCRPPHGGRGLKSFPGLLADKTCGSAPTRGPWIEICQCISRSTVVTSAPTRGPWIEIRCWAAPWPGGWSAPTRGPWIEIFRRFSTVGSPGMSAPTRGPWIEMKVDSRIKSLESGRPPHGGRGLKSAPAAMPSAGRRVGPHTGAVD